MRVVHLYRRESSFQVRFHSELGVISSSFRKVLILASLGFERKLILFVAGGGTKGLLLVPCE